MRKAPLPKRQLRRRGFQDGGAVTSNSIDPNYTSKLINQGIDRTRQMIGMAAAVKSLRNSAKSDAQPSEPSQPSTPPTPPTPTQTSEPTGSAGGEGGASAGASESYRRGGKIKKVMKRGRRR